MGRHNTKSSVKLRIKKENEAKKLKTVEVKYDRVKKSNNGKLFDLDSFCNIITYLDPQEICRLRAVCLLWHKYITHNPIWRSLFHSFLNPQQKDPEKPSDPTSYWFYEFSKSMNQFPQLSTMPKTFKTVTASHVKGLIKTEEVDEDEDIDYDDYEDKSITDVSYVMTKIPTTATVTVNTHKIAVMLSILTNSNEYNPKLTDLIKIGFKNHYKTMPLSRVCYALYHEKQHKLFPAEEIRLTDESEELDWIEDDVDAVAISPNIEGEFTPFLYLAGMESDFEENIEIEWEDFMGNFDSCYHWHSPENGWAPAFFNASFTWFYHMDIVSAYYADKKQLVCMLTQSATIS